MANGQIPQAQFLSQLRSKYPAYEEIPDSTLLDAILKKYPQYKEQIDFDAPTTTDDAEVSFDPSADGYDYETANQYELKPDSTGHWPSRVPDTGRILKGENHETFNQTIASETELGNVVYRGDDGLIYSHPKDSVSVSPENILSSEVTNPNSSATNLSRATNGADTGEKTIHSVDYGIPQINDSTWEEAFKQEYDTTLKEAMPEQHLEFAINRILLNSKGDSPAGIQNWVAYMNGSWAKYKDWTDEQYVSVLGADPKYLALIDSLAGAEASTVKAVFAAESDFDSNSIKTNYLPSSTTQQEEDVVPSLDLPDAGVILDKDKQQPTISQAPPKTWLENVGGRLANAWKYRDLTFQDPSQAAMAGRAQADYLALERLKDLSKKDNVFKHPNSPEWEEEVKEMVAWNVMSEPLLFSGQQDTALGRGLQAAQKDAYNRKILSGTPRERYKKALAEFDIGTGPAFAQDDDFLSLAWSNSLTGLAWKLASGNDVDLTFYEPSDHEQMAAGIVGLMMPLDALSFGIGGIVGKGGLSLVKATNLTAKGLNASSGRLARRRLIANGVSEAAADRAVRIAVNKTANRMASFGGALGTYEGLGSGLTQLDEKGFIDPVTWSKDVIAHTALGMVTGALAELGAAAPRIVKPLATGKGAKLTQEGLGFVGEVGGFGGFSPLLVEGRKPEFPKDFIDAGTFLIGIKLAAPLQQIYGQAAYGVIQKSVAFRIKQEYNKGKSFEEAQRTVHNELKSSVEIAMEREGLASDGSAVGMSSGGKGHILGEKPNISVDERGVGIILDANGNRIPYRPLSTQKELVLTGEIVEPSKEPSKRKADEPGTYTEKELDSFGKRQEDLTAEAEKLHDTKDVIVIREESPVDWSLKSEGETMWTPQYVEVNPAIKGELSKSQRKRAEEIVEEINGIEDAVINRYEPSRAGTSPTRGETGGKPRMVTTGTGRGQVPEKAEGETTVPGRVIDTKKVTEPVLDKEDKPVLDKEGEVVTKEVTKEIREEVPISEAVAREFELPAYLKKDALQSAPDSAFKAMLKDTSLSEREAQAIRVELERRKLTAPKGEDVSDLVQQRGNMQAEQNRLFQELQALKEGTPEYDAKEKQIVEMGGRIEKLDSQIAGKAVPVETPAKGERVVGRKGQKQLPGEAEVPLGEAGEGGVVKVAVGGAKGREPAPPKAEEAPVGREGKYEYDRGEYLLGPVESETGTKFGVFPKEDPRGGPVVTFKSRDKAVEWMDTQVAADKAPAKAELQRTLDKVAPNLEAETKELAEKNKNEPFLTESTTKELQERLSGAKKRIESAEARLEKFTDEALERGSDITKEMLEADVSQLKSYRAEVILLEAELAKRGGETPKAETKAPAKTKPSEPKFEDIKGSAGNKLGEINRLQEGDSFSNYGIRKDVKKGKEVYKIVVERTDPDLRGRVQTVEGEFFGSYKEAFDKLADRIARKEIDLDRSQLSKELQDAVLEVEKTFDNEILRKSTESDLMGLSKKGLIDLLDKTVHIGRYKSLGSLTKPEIVSELKKWQTQGDAARGKLGEKTTTTITKEPKPLTDKERENIEEKLLGEFGYKRGEVVNEERLLEQTADFEKASQLLSLGEPAYYAEKPLTETVVAWSDGVRLGEFKSKLEAHKVLNKYVKKHFKGISGVLSPDTPAPLYKKGEKVKLEKLMGKRYGEEGENLEVLSSLRVGNEWKYNVKGKDGKEFWTNELAIISRPSSSTKPISENLAKAKLSGKKQKVKRIEKAERGEVREDEPRAIQEMVIEKAAIEKKLAAEFKKGEKANEGKIRDLSMDKAALTEEINNAKLGKPRDGDQVTLTPTSKVTKGKKKVARRAPADTSGKIELQNIFESFKEQVLAQAVPETAGANPVNRVLVEIDYSKITAPEHSRFVETPVKGEPGVFSYDLEIKLPSVDGTYKVNVPQQVGMKAGKIDMSGDNNPFFKKFSKARINKIFAEPKIGAPINYKPPLTSQNAPIFKAPNRQSLAKSDMKSLESALKGYKKRLASYSKLKDSTSDVKRSIGELKEAIKIAEGLIKTQKEAERLGGTIAGVDIIPGATALFNAMRKWKRSKLPVSDRQKYDSLAQRSNKLYNEWVAGGKVDKEMEGRLEKLSTEMTRLEDSIKNQIPTEQEIVKVAEDMKWPTRTADLRRTHQKQRDLTKKMEENVELGADRSTLADPDFRDLKLQITKGRSDSQKDFTQEEMVHYEQVLNEMIRTGGYIDELPAMRFDKPAKTSKFISDYDFLFDKFTVIKNMGNAGRELADLAFRFVRNQTNITGAGENAVFKIKKLIGKKNLKHFVAAIDPYLAQGMDFKGKEAFLNNPKTKEAAKIWKEYTDRLHTLRKEYDTYVEFEIDGKKQRVKADDVYLDNWIRYQLKEDVAKDFALQGDGFYKEVNKLLASGKAKTIDEAKAIIGEWTRTSPFYKGPVRYGSADRLRLQQLSPELYETDFTNLAPSITRKYATFLAGAEAFGQDMSVRDLVVGKISTESGSANAKQANELLERIIDGEQKTSPRFPSFLARNFAAGHLTSPQTFKNNIMYSFTTDLPTYGVRNTLKGIFVFLGNPYKSIAKARERGQLGVGTREIKSITFEKGGAELMTFFGGIKPSEMINRAKSVFSAGSTAQTYIDYMSGKMDAEKISYFGKKKLERGRRFFREFAGFTDREIDAMVKRGHLTEKEMEWLESIVPSMTQGSTHPLFMPEIMSGKMEFAGSLYKMAYRATAGVHRSVIKPAFNGDFVPLSKWMAGTAIAGELQYFINYALFGWEHPSGGNFDDFIEYLHGEGAATDKFKEAALRLGRNIIRAQGFGIFSDAFQGYGMMPIAYDGVKNAYGELTYILTGKKTKLEAGEDFATAHMAIYRDWVKLQRARLSPRSKEFRRYGNVRTYVQKFQEKRKGKIKKGTEYPLSDNSMSIRAVKEAFWIADAEEMNRVMLSARKTMTDNAVARDEQEEIMTGKKARLEKFHDKEAKTVVEGAIRRLHPLYGISGNLRITRDGKSYLLKEGDKAPDAQIFYNSLNQREKDAVFEAVENYRNIIKELKLNRYIK